MLTEGIAHPLIVSSSPLPPQYSCLLPPAPREGRLRKKVVQREVLGDGIGDKGLGCPGEVVR